jgi:ferritin-like metal-binding protein YciE
MSDNTTMTTAIRTNVNSDPDADAKHSLQTYVSDLLALERHISAPLDAQRASDATAQYPAAQRLIESLHAQNAAHIAALDACLTSIGGHTSSPIKSAWATLLGGAASALGGSRKTKVTKWLRDDYTALNLATMSYTLLHATAIGLGDARVAALARQGLADYARSVIQINSVVPDVVLGELRDDGEKVVADAADTVREQTHAIWRGQSESTAN